MTTGLKLENFFTFLPQEVFNLILDKLDMNGLNQVRLINKDWKQKVEQPQIWHTLIKRMHPIIYKGLVDCESIPSKQQNWKEIFITAYNWEKQKYQQHMTEVEQEKPQAFALNLYVTNRINHQDFNVELWDKSKNEALIPIQQTDSTAIYSYQDSLQNTWKISLQILHSHPAFPLKDRLNLKCQPADVLALNQQKIVEKLQALAICLTHPITHAVNLIPLLSQGHRYQNLVHQMGENLLVGDEKALKIYAAPHWKLEENIQIPNETSFISDMAITAKKLIALTRDCLHSYEIQEVMDSEKTSHHCIPLWCKSIKEGFKKQVIIAEDNSPFFGLFACASAEKTLEVFNVETGERLFVLDNFKAKAIKINFGSIQYLNDTNQLVTFHFKRPNAQFSLS